MNHHNCISSIITKYDYCPIMDNKYNFFKNYRFKCVNCNIKIYNNTNIPKIVSNLYCYECNKYVVICKNCIIKKHGIKYPCKKCNYRKPILFKLK